VRPTNAPKKNVLTVFTWLSIVSAINPVAHHAEIAAADNEGERGEVVHWLRILAANLLAISEALEMISGVFPCRRVQLGVLDMSLSQRGHESLLPEQRWKCALKVLFQVDQEDMV
jgi:hypothetical protein